MRPLLSIIIPHFDRVALLGETLRSLAAQSEQRWEALVVDDGSPAECQGALARLCAEDVRVQLLHREHGPKGANTCRNLGIAQARGNYLLFLDSDDLLAPLAVANRLKIAAETPLSQVPIFQVEKFRAVPGDTGIPWNHAGEGDHLARFLRRDSVWHTSGPLWPREIVENLGGFDERLACWQDIDLHIRALAAGVSFDLHLELPADCYYRLHDGDSISQRPFAGRHQLESLVMVFLTAAALPACCVTAERRAALADMARGVAFKVLENRQIDLYRQVCAVAGRLKLFSPRLRLRLRLLESFFRCGGYRIKGSHRLRPYFHRMIEC